jgi:hypothetical protein
MTNPRFSSTSIWGSKIGVTTHDRDDNDDDEVHLQKLPRMPRKLADMLWVLEFVESKMKHTPHFKEIVLLESIMWYDNDEQFPNVRFVEIPDAIRLTLEAAGIGIVLYIRERNVFYFHE